ncbi:MAG: squalene--hopene cyclase [Rhodospirillales bacterium]|nr:MAG: squalene--hopene cyclase [Rhodospirillales bacterium]
MGYVGRLKAPITDTSVTNTSNLDAVIGETLGWLTRRQRSDGHWLFDLEADTTIPAEYILLNHYLDEIDDATEGELAAYIRARQGDHGGWPLFPGGDLDISASVKSYFALKLVGDDPEAPHMARARAAILAHGGAAKANVFTRITLALFGQVPWRAVPVIRVEAMLLPSWAPFHLDKVSYWSRTVMVPLFVLAALKPRARNPRGIDIRELFVTPPERHRNYLTNPTGHWLGEVLLVLDRLARVAEPAIPKFLERKAIARAMAFVQTRLNGEDGLGGIFPAMANAVMAFDALGYSRDHPDYVTARAAIQGLLSRESGETMCQPCLSPVWDTSLALHTLLEAGCEPDNHAVRNATDWLRKTQVLDVVGDWASRKPDARPGGWAFQYRNDHYPDVDDTAVVVMALQRVGSDAVREAVDRGVEWVLAMQSENGGWGAFDADNQHYFLEHMPFADHGALLDPPTADVSARCLGMLAQGGYDRDHPAVARAIRFLKDEQEEDGSWFGRWGTNYIYGTWSVLAALNAAGEDMGAPYIRKAVAWLKARQRADGGWGEDCATYWPDRRNETKASTPSQTAWALLALMAAGEVDAPEVARGIAYLVDAPRDEGKWQEGLFNAVGFPRVFYLRYHGYSAYFPLWALARYRNLRQSNTRRVAHGL